LVRRRRRRVEAKITRLEPCRGLRAGMLSESAMRQNRSWRLTADLAFIAPLGPGFWREIQEKRTVSKMRAPLGFQ
jgi:hypothetical protein